MIDRIPTLVTSAELTAVANFTSDDGDPANAEKYHLRAIEAAPAGHYKLLAEVHYTGFLFQQHGWEKARNEVANAISSDAGSDDLAFADRGWAYQRWAWNEATIANDADRAKQRYRDAEGEYKGIRDARWQKQNLDDLKYWQEQTVPQVPASPGSGKAPQPPAP